MTTFLHSGDMGDVIFGALAVKVHGGGVVYLSDGNEFGTTLNESKIKSLIPLLEAQPYINKAERWDRSQPIDVNLNKFRHHVPNIQNLQLAHLQAINKPDYPYKDTPWLQIDDPIVVPGKPYVVCRGQKWKFFVESWIKMYKEFAGKAIFIGFDYEYTKLKEFCPNIDFYKADDCLEMARLIAGSVKFFGNFSLGLAIAIGLKKNCEYETMAKGIRHAGGVYPTDWMKEII